MQHFDTIVIGVGGFGSGALYHLARRGQRVVGIEQFDVAHDRGSSHGETRIIRKAYFEHADYVPLLHRAYELWRALEGDARRKLLHQVGLFLAGPSDCESVHGTLLAAKQHQLRVEQLDSVEAARRFPGYRFRNDDTVVFEAEAGYLDVEQCVAEHVAVAQRHGAELRTQETVLNWESNGRSVTVQTNRSSYHADSLVITAGPWAAALLDRSSGAAGGAVWKSRLQVVRKPVFWFRAGDQFDVARGNSTFFFEDNGRQFYGFPRIDGQTIKMAEHTGGEPVGDPLTVDRELRAADVAAIGDFLRERIPGIDPQPVRHSVCMYTRTPDCHFCIDVHPEFKNVAVGAGFSGHGFKFTSVLGEALADLAQHASTSLPVQFLGTKRFG